MEQRTKLVPEPRRKVSALDRELDPFAQRIRQSGVEAIWKIGEQLQAAKARVIELTGDRRAPGFAQWTHHTFGWSKSNSQSVHQSFRTEKRPTVAPVRALDKKERFGHTFPPDVLGV